MNAVLKPQPAMPEPFAVPVRVYVEDVDFSGVVYHGHYARYLDRARTDWLRMHGIDQTRLAEQLGCFIVVRRMNFDLLRPARLDDVCLATFEVLEMKRVSATVRQTLVHGDSGQLLVSAEVQLACLSVTAFRPSAFPPQIQALFGPGR